MKKANGSPRLTDAQMRDFARRGAVVRMKELADEEQLLKASFPEVFGAVVTEERRADDGAAQPWAEHQERKAKRPRRSMTPAQRRAHSKRMRAFWASRRAEKEQQE